VSTRAWDLLATPQAIEDAAWELFHENSKLTSHDPVMSEAVANAYMAQIPESLVFEGYPEVNLPENCELPPILLSEALKRDNVTLELEPSVLALETITALLKYGYGALDNTEGRRRRSVYSAGSLFPLELFAHIVRVAGLEPGLYHYYSPANSLRLLRKGNHSQKIAAAFVDPRCVQAAALTVFIAVVPERSVFRYGDRGYRFALLEAGAVVQNLNLAAASLDLRCANAGEFFDNEIDDVLDFDGLSVSTLYSMGIGKALGTDTTAGNGHIGK
jgi:SagB-type dehydrogenase family enzyme